jgi:uncharacterized protein
MSSNIFVNLPVKDLKRSMAFFQALGFTFNPQFSDDTAACMIIGENNYAMLLTHEKFGQFSKKTIIDATTSVEVLIAVSFESRSRVDKILDAALKAGGTEPNGPRDYGFMYQRSFDDPDGHTWEIFHMDESAFPKG